MLQLGGDSSRLAALKAGKIQYTFLGAAASEQARSQGLKVLATAQQMNIPFPGPPSSSTSRGWKRTAIRRTGTSRRARSDPFHEAKPRRERKNDRQVHAHRRSAPRKRRVRLQCGTFPDLPYPTLEGMKLILENLAAETPEFARHKPEEFADGSLVERLKRERFLESLR
jgi:hypothetical protein